MGIPGFNIWFSERYKKAYVPLGKVRVDHLYIDLNSVLHTVMRRAKNHNHFHKMLHKRLHQIMDITQPTKSVMIAVDGPAPLAKLLTQRDRRKKAGRTMDEGETLTGAAITPGTTFMLDLTHSLTYFCCAKISSRRFRKVVFELSDGTVMGEGEVKVLGRLARHWYPEDPNDTHVILGDDADLILMALTSYKENLFVANSGLNDGRLNAQVPVFSVNLLHQQWAASLLAGVVAGGQVPLQSALLHAKLDLTLIAIMSKGNDYLPGVKGVSMERGGGSGLWPAYQAAVASYTPSGGGGGGGGAVGGEGSSGPGAKRGKWAGGRPVGQLGDSGSVTSIDPATGAPRLDAGALSRLLRMVAGDSSDSGDDSREWRGSKAAADPQQYLQGCVWLLQMYLTGQCPDYRFYYDGVAPTAAAVREACDAAVSSGHPYITLTAPFAPAAADPRATRPLLPVACALALLPRTCQHLAAPCVRHLMASPRASEDGAAGVAAAAVGVAVGVGGKGSAAAAVAAFEQELYYELYGECGECRSFTAEVARLQRIIADTRAARNIAAKRLAAVQEGTAPLGEASEAELQAEIDQADNRVNSAKSTLRSVEAHRKQHISSAHPYRRFPAEQLEAAAEAALASARILPEERPATGFGRPHILRAFDNRAEAAAFIRTQSAGLGAAAASGTQPHSPFGPGGQRRHASSSSSSQAYQPYGQHPGHTNSTYSPPPPPFKVEQETYFAAIVRQEVLHDEYGSGRDLELRLAPHAPGEAVRYLVGDEQSQPGPQTGHQPQRQQQQQQLQGQPPPLKRHEAWPPPGSAAAAVVAVSGGAGRPAAVAVAAAAAGAPASVDVVTAAAAAVTIGAKAGPPATTEDDAGQVSSQGKKRGRPKGAKNKPKAAAAGVGGSGAGNSSTAAATVAAAATGPKAPMPLRGAGPPPPPPMPSSWLISTARTAHSEAHVTAPRAPPPPYNPLQYSHQAPQPPSHPPAASAAYGQAYPSYGVYGTPAAQPNSAVQQQQQPYYGAYGSQRPQQYGGAGQGYGGPGAAAHMPFRPTVVPPPVRPPSPSPAVAAAAAAAAPGRGRTAPASGPRWS